MSKLRRTFSPEFKQQAVCLVLDQGYSHMEASPSASTVFPEPCGPAKTMTGLLGGDEMHMKRLAAHSVCLEQDAKP